MRVLLSLNEILNTNLKAKIWGNFAFKISFNVSNFSRLPKKKDRFCPLSMLKYTYSGV